MKKIVVLNSGGFDSTVLLASMCGDKNIEVHSLYFSYGQLNGNIDSRIARENARKLGAIHHEIKLPQFTWSNSEFYEEDSNEYYSQYVEMRNMIFISYAMSFAESICASSIHMAILKSHGYVDTSKQFIGAVKNLCNVIGITFDAPYCDCEKQDLFVLAKQLGVGTKYEFISCDTPENGVPCGKCGDCESLEEFYEILEDDLPVKRFFTSGFNTHDSKFQELFLSTPIEEMRVLLNNDCQLNCEHCYHNGNPLIQDILTDEELVKSICDAYNLGIKSIHYSGKEPLFNDRIFKITDKVKQVVPDMDFTVVTNGINVPKYAEQIKSCGISKVFLSSDDEFSTVNGTRPTGINKVIKNAVEALNSVGVPVEIFYDLTPDNIGHTLANIKFWRKKYKVKDFYVRTIRNVGNAENFPKLDIKDICDLHYELKSTNLDCNIVLNIGACPYTYDICFSGEDFTHDLVCDFQYLGYSGSSQLTDHYSLLMECYCCRFEHQITLTADGYVLGCAMECSCKDYDKTSSGNIRNKSLSQCIFDGKKQSIRVNESQINEGKIYFQKCSFTPIDISE